MPKRAIIIHGWEGYPEEGWRPWLKKELEARGWEIRIPAMPDTMYPKQDAWVNHLKGGIVGAPDRNTYFVGHSLGCITILRYLETLEEGQEIGGAILIAGFVSDLDYPGYHGELANFFEEPIDWQKIKKHCKQFVVIHSDNDPLVPLKHMNVLKEQLEAKAILEHDMKHFSGDDGVTELWVVFRELLRISGSLAERIP